MFYIFHTASIKRVPPLIFKGGYIGLSSAQPECVTSSVTGTVSRTPGKFSNECSPSAIILEVRTAVSFAIFPPHGGERVHKI